MKQYELTHMIIDDESNGEEHVTANFTHENEEYSITFQKSDLEIINTWVLKDHHSLPANLSDEIVESIRKDVKERI